MKTQKRSYAIFFIIVLLLLASEGILIFILPQRAYSENENRYLTTIEPPSFSAFLDTSMQENLTNGANDQFVGRDFWMKCATTLQLAAGFQDMQDVYLGKNGYYFERILDSDLSQSRYQNNLRYLEQFASLYETEISFLPVPSKGTILKEYLPKNAVLYHSDDYFDLAETIANQTEHLKTADLRETMTKQHNAAKLYFKTDHHWTMDAAYLAYTALCEITKEDPMPQEYFSPECVNKSFYGTLYSKAPSFHTQPDQLWIPKNLPEAEIYIDSKQATGIYDWDKLNTKDKYGIYFGGNFSKINIHIQNPAKHASHKKLLIIKDSFANSLVPFLMEQYAEITMLDFRYYNESVSSLMHEERPTDVLVLYEMSNFAQDMNFFKILK